VTRKTTDISPRVSPSGKAPSEQVKPVEVVKVAEPVKAVAEKTTPAKPQPKAVQPPKIAAKIAPSKPAPKLFATAEDAGDYKLTVERLESTH